MATKSVETRFFLRAMRPLELEVPVYFVPPFFLAGTSCYLPFVPIHGGHDSQGKINSISANYMG